ncbi:major capsid protein [Pseudomonas aeruginosa]
MFRYSRRSRGSWALVDGLGEIVATESGHARPPDLFISAFAQADYMEVVNTEGLPYYAKLEHLPFDKGVAGEAQSNPLHLCTRPLAVRELTL